MFKGLFDGTHNSWKEFSKIHDLYNYGREQINFIKETFYSKFMTEEDIANICNWEYTVDTMKQIVEMYERDYKYAKLVFSQDFSKNQIHQILNICRSHSHGLKYVWSVISPDYDARDFKNRVDLIESICMISHADISDERRLLIPTELLKIEMLYVTVENFVKIDGETKFVNDHLPIRLLDKLPVDDLKRVYQIADTLITSGKVKIKG